MVQMALRTVAYIILALVSIGLILSLIPKLSESASKQYCAAYTKTTLGSTEPIPEECLAYVAQHTEKTVVLSGTAYEVSSSLTAYIVSCGKAKAPTCYTLQLSTTDRQITNSDVADILLVRGINISVSTPLLFTNNSLVVVGYDAANETVVVK